MDLILAKLNDEQIIKAKEINGRRKLITHALIAGDFGTRFGTEKQCRSYYSAWSDIFSHLFNECYETEHHEISQYTCAGNVILKLVEANKKHTFFDKGETMTKQERIELYKEYLEEEGYRPKIDEEGDLEFKYQGCRIMLQVDDDDENFFCLFVAYSIDEDEDIMNVYQAVNEANKLTRVAKATVGESCIIICTEQFLSSPELFKDQFDRCVISLDVCTESFYDALHKETEETVLD
jgi:hypothetical protein